MKIYLLKKQKVVYSFARERERSALFFQKMSGSGFLVSECERARHFEECAKAKDLGLGSNRSIHDSSQLI